LHISLPEGRYQLGTGRFTCPDQQCHNTLINIQDKCLEISRTNPCPIRECFKVVGTDDAPWLEPSGICLSDSDCHGSPLTAIPETELSVASDTLHCRRPLLTGIGSSGDEFVWREALTVRVLFMSQPTKPAQHSQNQGCDLFAQHPRSDSFHAFMLFILLGQGKNASIFVFVWSLDANDTMMRSRP